jgi:cell volume regulation protein A
MLDENFQVLAITISVLMIISVAVSRASTSYGVPALLLFLGVGMLAGSEGPGGVDFSNYNLSFLVGSYSLAFILFDGGLRTSWNSIRPILKIGVSLASLGVILTAVFVALFCHYILSMSWLEASLLGSIVSSTDAAAVFSTLRSQRLSLKGGLREVLEFEAGSNDPTAIFLTLSVLMFFQMPDTGVLGFVQHFLLQAILGLALGFSGGKLIVLAVNKFKISSDGLYSVLIVGSMLFVFSLTNLLQGSGFLAVYVAGVVVGNSSLLRKTSILLFHDGVAWIAQIVLFLTLGLLVFPSHLVGVLREGIILCLFMMLIARPLSVFISTLPFRMKFKHQIFISWIGLRGAAPIILAILPMSVNFPNAEYFFNLVFFIVISSVLLQGFSIPWLAKKLDVTEEMGEQDQDNLTFLPQGFFQYEFEIFAHTKAAQKNVVELNLPAGVLLVSLERNGRFMLPRGETVLLPEDRIKALARPSNLTQLEEIFGKRLS